MDTSLSLADISMMEICLRVTPLYTQLVGHLSKMDTSLSLADVSIMEMCLRVTPP